MFQRWRSFYRVLRSRPDFEAGMAEELRFHIERYTADLVRSGITPDEAARRARMEFGSVNGIQEDCRESRGLHLPDELLRQLRYAARLLRKTPGFTITALLTLALCLGANLTIFAVIDTVLLRPLPFPDARRLVTVFNTYPKAGVERDGSSTTNYYERRGRIPAFSSLSMYRYGTAIVGDPGATVREPVMQVSPEFFSTLGQGPTLGRAFTEAETTYQTGHVVILTEGYWRQHFNSDLQIVGRQIRVDGIAATVVGVLPSGFRFLSSEAQLYFPFSSRPQDRGPRERHSGGNSKQLIARLRPGAGIEEAQSQIDAQNASLELDNPQAKMMADAGFRSIVRSLHADHVASIRSTLLLLEAAVLALLLIGAVNLVNLLLVRANGRIKELAVRQALGASRRHVVSEVIVETTLLTILGGLLGLAVGAGGIRLLSILGASRLPLGSHIVLDSRVALAALATTIVMGILLAAPIAWFNLHGHLANGLQSEARGGSASHAAQTLRHSFLIAQVALAFVLLAGSGLLARSLQRAMSVSPGFRSDHVLTGQISLPSKDYPTAQALLAFTEKLEESVGGQPGVVAAGIVTNVPLSGNSGKSAVQVKGRALLPSQSPRGHYSYGVGGDYFAALGFTLKEGRFLNESDSRRAARSCVVDEDFARYYWPHGGALGQRVFQGSSEGPDAEAYTIVGVVGSVKQAGLTDAAAQGAIYYPFGTFMNNEFFVAVRSTQQPDSLALSLQRVVRQIDPGLPVNDIRSMQTRIADSLVTRRSPAMLAAVFSSIALLLIAIGVYGVLSYSVAQRRREIGLRMALGARPQQIRAQFFGLALRLLTIGMTLGLLGAALTGFAIRTILFQVQPFDIPALTAATAILGLVSLIACLLPSHRAARISPLEALSE